MNNHDIMKDHESCSICLESLYDKVKYLDNCDIWVTLQPCEMCMGMIKQVRIKRLYYGASIPNDSIKNKINNRVCSEIYSGIREDECSKLIKDFFIKIRSD